MDRPTDVKVSPNALLGPSLSGEVTIRHGGQSRVEPFDVVASLAAALDRREFEFETLDAHDPNAVRLRLSVTGLELRTLVHGIHALSDGRRQTVSVVAVQHPTLFPAGLFEYQHATGRFVSGALVTGFADWIDTDLDVLVEAVTGQADRCTLLDVIVPPSADDPTTRRRRAFIGPIEQRGSSALPRAPEPATEGAVFGPSLVLTRSPEAFGPLLDQDDVVAIKFYGVRRTDGFTGADCRVNGREFAPGKAALHQYVKTWPGRGPRAEKQYVVIRTMAE